MRHFRFKLSPSPACFFDFIIILSFLMWAIFYVMTTTINVPTFHLDGAFQMASGIFRFDSGQFPGKDFFPYLGIGPLFTLYPAFKASGQDIFASVFFAQFMTLISGGLSVSVIWHLMGAFGIIAHIFCSRCCVFCGVECTCYGKRQGPAHPFRTRQRKELHRGAKAPRNSCSRATSKIPAHRWGAASSTPTGSVCSAF